MADSTAVIMARMDERLRNIAEKFDDVERARKEEQEELNRRIALLETRLKTIEDMAIRYKGGFVAVLSLGGVIGWLTSNLDFVKTLAHWIRGA